MKHKRLKDWATHWDANQSRLDAWLASQIRELSDANSKGLNVKLTIELAVRRAFVAGFNEAQLN